MFRYTTPEDKLQAIATEAVNWIAARARVGAKYINRETILDVVSSWCKQHPEKCRLDDFSRPSPNVVAQLFISDIETYH